MKEFFRVESLVDDSVYHEFETEKEARAYIDENDLSDSDWVFKKLIPEHDGPGDEITFSFANNEAGMPSGMVITYGDKSHINYVSAMYYPNGRGAVKTVRGAPYGI